MLEQELREIYANAPTGKTVLHIFSISASWFSQTYHLQNQLTEGVDVVLEDNTTVTAVYVPLENNESSNEGDLNYSRKLVIQQINDLIASEYDNWQPGDEKPDFDVRVYVLYRDETVSSLKEGPIRAKLQDIDFSDADTASLNVTTTPANRSSTGERATIARIPMQAGFL